jgi:glycerophosphoryl diester phosphodiesterase
VTLAANWTGLPLIASRRSRPTTRASVQFPAMDVPAPALPRIVAHRGNAAEFPENTLPALRSALELGVTHIEFDVHLTADHVPIVLHDADLKRTAGVAGNPLEMTAQQLAGIKAGEPARFGGKFGDVGIPSLEQVTGLLRSFPEATAFVELKRTSLQAFGHETVVSQVCAALGPVASQCVVISFDLKAVELARKLAQLPIGWVLSEVSALTALQCESARPDYLFCNHERLPQDGTRLWRGLWSWVIYEVTSGSQALELSARGADFVETMQVRSLLHELKEAGRR